MKMRLITNGMWIALVLLTLGANFACAASFDCDKAGTKVEKMICADPELSKLDEELGKAYNKALEANSDQASIKQKQRDWLKERNKCANSECIRTRYQDRIANLGKTVSEVSQPTKQDNPLVFKLEDGNDRDVCRDMAENLNRVQPSLASFSTEVVFDPRMTQFSWPDWKELDIKDYLDVVYAIENKLMHIYPSETKPFDEWKKEYLTNMKTGTSGGFSDLGQVRRVWRPRLRIAYVKFKTNGKLETVLGYTRNRDVGEWQKGWRAECLPDYLSTKNSSRFSACGKSYDKRMGIKSLEGYPGDYIVSYDSEKRKVDFILSGDRGAGASSLISFFLFLHNGIGYMSLADITGMSMSRIERIIPERQTVPSWVRGRYICGIPYPRSKSQ